MSNKMFERMCGLDDSAEQELITQGELDQQLKIVSPDNIDTHINGQTGSIIGWRDSGSEKGRGVYATQDIPKGTKIETAPIVIVAEKDVPASGGAPDGYLLDWEPENEGMEHCMALGYVMLYNHSRDGNLYLENDHSEMTITSFAARDIKAGEELSWDYNCEIWFDEGK